MQHKIVIVDDDQNIRTSVVMAFEAEGFYVSEYSNGAEALEDLLTGRFNVIILDIKMPRMDGIELLKKLREKIMTPVIFLTSKDDELDELLGLRLGADDYITKPFSMKLLIERVHTLIRREKIREKISSNQLSEREGMNRLGSLSMIDDTYECYWKGKPVNLTVTEYMLLKSLLEVPGQIKSRIQILEDIKNEKLNVAERSIDSHIRRLRNKFKKCDEDFSSIESVYGAGYRFNVDV